MEDVIKLNLIHLHINRMLGAARVELLRCSIVILKTQVPDSGEYYKLSCSIARCVTVSERDRKTTKANNTQKKVKQIY